ncbi:MAG TPA: DUF2203 domain-containing protein [Nitrososphaeraceae archaeon]|jgi:hypothetical protein|nr:DUF2203 domain-containing protein [Nitrososphaeraceae archaeon]
MSILFTVDQANTILPKVKKRFDEILFCKNNVIDIQEELQNLSDSNCSFEKFITKKQELNHAVTSLYSMIQKLEDMGVMIKSVDEGLLDFPSIRYDEEIWLCWKFGENQVKFWHGKEEGFMGRKPIPQEGFEYVDDFADLR